TYQKVWASDPHVRAPSRPTRTRLPYRRFRLAVLYAKALVPEGGRSCSAHDRNRSLKIRPDNLVCAAGSGTGSTETHRCQKLPIDQAVRRHIVVGFVSANCSSRVSPHDTIDVTIKIP